MYKDKVLEARQQEYRKCKFNIQEQREKQNLSLRKQKLDAYLLEKRLKTKGPALSQFGVNPLLLKLEGDLRNINSEDLDKIEVTNIVFDLLRSNEDNMKWGVHLIRNYLSVNRNVAFSFLLERGLIEFCVSVVQNSKDLNLIYEVLWILTNISFLGNYEMNLKMVEQNNLQIYIDFLQKADISEVTIQMLWLFLNLVSEHADFRDILFSASVVDILIEKLTLVMDVTNKNYNDIRKSYLKITIELLFSMVKNDLRHHSLIPQLYKIIPVFTNVSIFHDDQNFSNCIWGLMFISKTDDPNNPLAIPNLIMDNNGNFLLTLLALDYEGDYKNLIIPALRIIGDLLSFEDFKLTQLVLEMGTLEFLDNLLTREKKKSIIKEAIWVISNIAAGDITHIQELVESNVYSKLLSFTNDYDFLVKKEAIITIMNICFCTNITLSTDLVKRGIFRLIIDVIENDNESKIVDLALNAVTCIFNSGKALEQINGVNIMCRNFEKEGGCAVLEKLQTHPNNQIYEKAIAILDTFFNTKEVSYDDFMGKDTNVHNNDASSNNFSLNKINEAQMMNIFGLSHNNNNSNVNFSFKKNNGFNLMSNSNESNNTNGNTKHFSNNFPFGFTNSNNR